MSWLSKAWKGIKKAVKKVARTIKKVAKKVAYTIPGGKQLWKLGTKVAKKTMAGVGKFLNKLGPLKYVAIAAATYFLGPAASGLWAAMGTGAAAIGGTFGAVLSGIHTGLTVAGSFVSGTLGALGTALTEGASNVLAGNFSAGLTSFATNLGSALSGEAGMAAVNASMAGISTAATTSTGGMAGIEASAPTATELFGAAPGGASMPELLTTNIPSQATGGLAGMEAAMPTGAELFGTAQSPILPNAATVATNNALGTNLPTMQPLSSAGNGVDAAMPTGEELFGTAGNPTLKSTSLLEQAQDSYNKAQDLVNAFSNKGGGGEGGGGQPRDFPDFLKSAVAGSAGASGRKGGGVGSSGFSLLDPVRGLRESVQASQNRMFT